MEVVLEEVVEEEEQINCLLNHTKMMKLEQ